MPFTTGKSSKRLKNVNLNPKSMSCLFGNCPPALWPMTSHSRPISYCPLMILALLRMKKVTKSIVLEMYPRQEITIYFLKLHTYRERVSISCSQACVSHSSHDTFFLSNLIMPFSQASYFVSLILSLPPSLPFFFYIRLEHNTLLCSLRW